MLGAGRNICIGGDEIVGEGIAVKVVGALNLVFIRGGSVSLGERTCQALGSTIMGDWSL